MTAATRPGREPALDAVRGLAAVAIAVLHALGVPGGGITGVTSPYYEVLLETGLAVFFVLSGYLIAGPFVRALVDGAAMPSLRGYALRRVMRIVPGYWVAFAIAALAISAVAPGEPASVTWGTGHLQAGDWFASALFAQNLVPSLRGQGVLPVMWTLTVEIVFYAAVGLAAWSVARRVRRAAPGAVLVGVLVVWAASALLQWRVADVETLPGVGQWLGWLAQQLMFLSLFCPGVLIALLRTRAASERWHGRLAWLADRRVRDFGPMLALAMVSLAFVVRHGNETALGLTATAEWRRQPQALAALVVVALALTARGRTWAFCARVLAPLGTISYGIYLYHWVVLRELVDHHVYPVDVPGWAALPAKVGLALLLTLPLATLSWYLVERPALRWAARRSGPRISRLPGRRAALRAARGARP